MTEARTSREKHNRIDLLIMIAGIAVVLFGIFMACFVGPHALIYWWWPR